MHTNHDGDHVMQGQAAAAQALEEAMAATREAAQRVDATVSILRQVQVPYALRSLVVTHSRPVYVVCIVAFIPHSQLLLWTVHETAASAMGCDVHNSSADMLAQDTSPVHMVLCLCTCLQAAA